MNAPVWIWVLYMTITPQGINHQYIDAYGSWDKCNAVIEQMRKSGAVNSETAAVDCTDRQPRDGEREYFVPRNASPR